MLTLRPKTKYCSTLQTATFEVPNLSYRRMRKDLLQLRTWQDTSELVWPSSQLVLLPYSAERMNLCFLCKIFFRQSFFFKKKLCMYIYIYIYIFDNNSFWEIIVSFVVLFCIFVEPHDTPSPNCFFRNGKRRHRAAIAAVTKELDPSKFVS